ncbi:tubulin-like doman-containing protein [Anaerolinea thermophila]|uniref:Tubulin-like protein n=1 Tax=Anaerolinea thermophila (strain DSM 14523 / JCM 11388 / NBRC 100420 / UNI-1) TaxID=926569 RepID=E8MZG4_ANATU|nr:tubulin-like doman-containing protein [Anaerolinea thermophila]BAJ64512.1 hypothetical protein ANT_24860 [Anaerolinea thermophila UNI-1]
MKRGALVIGLGGSGAKVVARLRQKLALTSSPFESRVQFLAFDRHQPTGTTGRLPQTHAFLTHLNASRGESAQAQQTRSSVRTLLVEDLRQGESSQVLRSLGEAIEVLRQFDINRLDIFLVASTFGLTGSAWAVDIAHLARHLAAEMKPRVIGVFLTPETLQASIPVTREHRLRHFVVLKELEAFQRERPWKQPYPLYPSSPVEGLPPALHQRPFDTLQILDCNAREIPGDTHAIPATADVIYYQLDAQVSAVLEEAAQYSPIQGNACFDTAGVYSVIHPSQYLLNQARYQLILEVLQTFFPVETDPLSGVPTHLVEPLALRPDSPYGKLNEWLKDVHRSGILQDIVQAAEVPAHQQGAQHERLNTRGLTAWKMILYQAEGAEHALPSGTEMPESLQPFREAHWNIFLRTLLERLTTPDPKMGTPGQYLERLLEASRRYTADLKEILNLWEKQGENAENETLREQIREAQQQWEARRRSFTGRLIPGHVQDAERQFLELKQRQVFYHQREVVVKTILEIAEKMRELLEKLNGFYQNLLQALIFHPDSVFNIARMELSGLKRELEKEKRIPSQELVIDEHFERHRVQTVKQAFLEEFPALIEHFLHSGVLRAELDNGEFSIPYPIERSSESETEEVDLSDPHLPPQALASHLNRMLGETFATWLLREQPGNTVLSFLSYISSRADQVAQRMAQKSEPLLRTISPVQNLRSFLFMPASSIPLESPYPLSLRGELREQIGDIYLIQTENPDELALFRVYHGIALDQMWTLEENEPRPLNPAELKPHILWIV